MASDSNLYAIIAIIAGIAAVSLTGGFFYLNDGFAPVGPVVHEPIADNKSFIAYIVFAYLFQVGTPLLCAGAFFFGFSARRSWAARTGIALATVSLLIYILTVRACLQLIE